MTASSTAATLLGSQTPRILKSPERVGTHGPRVCQFLDMCGVNLLQWQRGVMDELFAYDASGAWAATEFGALVARQNGKGEILLGYDLAHLFMFPRANGAHKTILHTSHETKTNDEAFQKLEAVIRSVPQLDARVAHIYTANGQEGVTLKPRKGQKRGDRIRFVARSKNSGRGFTASNVIYDEAQEFSRQAYKAISYTQTTIKNRQELFAGTVPEDGINDSEVFEGLRDRGRDTDGYPRTGWAEWSPTGAEDPDLAASIDKSDETAWLEANPSAGYLIELETIAEQLERDKSPNAEDFGMERLSIWPARRPEAEVVLHDMDMSLWGDHVASEKDASLPDGGALTVNLGRGGGFATVSYAARLTDGRIGVRTLHTATQTLWVPAKLLEFKNRYQPSIVALDSKNCAPVLTDIDALQIPYMSLNASEIAGAFGLFIESWNSGQVAHYEQRDLYESFKNAGTRPLVGGTTWEQVDPAEPITQAQSVTFAFWAVKKFESAPPKVEAVITGIR